VGRDWPIDCATRAPFYLDAETRMGVAGDDPPDTGPAVLAPRQPPCPMAGLPPSYLDRMLPEPVARNGRVYDGRPPCCGNDTGMPICPIGAQFDGIHAAQRAGAAGARVMPEAVAHFVELGGAGRAQAVRFLRPDGSEWRVTAAPIVLAANGIETPLLMPVSAQERAPDGLGNAGGALGRNPMDHSGTSVVFAMPRPGRGPQEMTSILKGRAGRFRSDFAAKKLHLRNGSSVGPVAEEKIDAGRTGTEPSTAVRDTAARRRANANCHEQLPERTNRLTLSGRADPLGPPRPAIQLEVGEYVRRSAKHTADVCRDMVDALGAKLVSVRDGSDDFADNNHIMGGTIMGEDPGDSAVAAETRVHGVENLWVASSSVVPSSAGVNCTLTIAALGLRTAGRIDARLRDGR
jgi:choline dehydrogenase-like flavoprotein